MIHAQAHELHLDQASSFFLVSLLPTSSLETPDHLLDLHRQSMVLQLSALQKYFCRKPRKSELHPEP